MSVAIIPKRNVCVHDVRGPISPHSGQFYKFCSISVYQPIKLMRSVTAMVDEVCLKALDNAALDLMMPRINPSKLPPKYEAYAVKNGRRIMEDRHVVIDDFNGLFDVKVNESQRTGFYAIFDGHGGLDAAAYSVSHLHYHLSESVYYPNSPAEAIKDAFVRTDKTFIQKNEYRVSIIFFCSKSSNSFAKLNMCIFNFH